MTTEEIYIEGLLNYIYCAFDNDIELLMYYDRGASVKTLDDACINVYEKVRHTYPDSICIGVRKEGKKAGYFVYSPGLLISFGLNKKYRDKEGLSEFWKLIVDAIGPEFGCGLYAQNTRAINWLKKCNMEVVVSNVTILKFKN